MTATTRHLNLESSENELEMMNGSKGHWGRSEEKGELSREITENSMAWSSWTCAGMPRKDLEKDLWLMFRPHEPQVLAGHSGEDVQQTEIHYWHTSRKSMLKLLGGVFQTKAAVEGQGETLRKWLHLEGSRLYIIKNLGLLLYWESSGTRQRLVYLL